MTAERLATGDLTSRALRPSLWLLALTSVHHAYGALAFDTPWRWHVVPIALIAAGLLVAAASFARRAERRAARIAKAIVAGGGVLRAGRGLGGLVGRGNHAVKNALYFGGAPAQLMATLFPPPTYEWPHDLFFEASGIAQGLLGALVLWRWYGLVRAGTWGNRPAAAPRG